MQANTLSEECDPFEYRAPITTGALLFGASRVINSDVLLGSNRVTDFIHAYGDEGAYFIAGLGSLAFLGQKIISIFD